MVVTTCSVTMTTLDYSYPFEVAVRPFGVKNILTLGAGPCTVSPRVLHALSAQTLQPLNKEFDQVRQLIDHWFYLFIYLIILYKISYRFLQAVQSKNLNCTLEESCVCINTYNTECHMIFAMDLH